MKIKGWALAAVMLAGLAGWQVSGQAKPEPKADPGMSLYPPYCISGDTGKGRDYYSRLSPRQRQELERRLFLDRLRHEDPKRFQRILKIEDRSRDYRRTRDPARKQAIEKQLRPLLDAELKAQQDETQKRVADLEKRLQEMKEMLKQRDANWEQVVDHNFKEITGQLDYLDFPTVPPLMPKNHLRH